MTPNYISETQTLVEAEKQEHTFIMFCGESNVFYFSTAQSFV